MGCVPFRFWIGVILFLSAYINYSARVNMSISIISLAAKHRAGKTPECLAGKPQENKTQKSAEQDPVYDWNQTIQGLILGGYFWGFIISSLPGGAIAEFIGPFHTIFWLNIVTAIMNEFCVLAPEIHYMALIGARFVIGLAAGLWHPALQCMIAHWAPPEEKGKFVGVLMGTTLGTCATFPIVGQITTTFGWKWGFHFITIQMLVFCLLFWCVAADSPEKHRCISEEEKNFIVESHAGSLAKKKSRAPLKAILRSLPFWALTVGHFGNLWGLYLQMTGVPKYITEVIGFNLAKSGFLAALPQLARVFCGMAFGAIADMLTKKEICSPRFVRKGFVIFSHILPGVLLICISFVGCNWIPILALLAMSLALNGAAVVTSLQNIQDLAPNFAGTIVGLISFLGGPSGFITPAVTAMFIKEHNGIVQWAYNFWCGGIVYISCGVFFFLFASVELQPWNTVPD